jgi:DNA-directed RNA polymerase subunit L
MDKISKINLKVIDMNNILGESSLQFKLSGDNINYIILNTIRRTILAEIPIYAFNEFKFEKNTTVLHNDYLKQRLRHIPIWNIENTIDSISPKKLDEIKEVDFDENDEYNPDTENEPLNTSTLKQMTMYLNFKNKTNEIVSATTDDAKFYYEEKQVASPYKVAVPLVRLQPNQEVAFSAITTIGTETENAMYSAVCIAAYKEITPTEYEFNIESRGQITEKRIVQVSLLCIEKRLKNFLKLVKEHTKLSGNEGIIVINNEDHTLGNLISRGMQCHKKILFAGYNLTHPRVAKVNFHYKHEKDADIIKIMEDVVNYYLEIFSNIKKLVDKEI